MSTYLQNSLSNEVCSLPEAILHKPGIDPQKNTAGSPVCEPTLPLMLPCELTMEGIHSVFKTNFFKRVPLNVLKQITQEIALLPPLTEGIINALKERDYRNPIFQLEHWTYQAIQAFFAGHLDVMTLSHLFLYDSCKDLKGFQCHTDQFPTLFSDILHGLFDKKPSSKDPNEHLVATAVQLLPPEDRQIFSFLVPYMDPCEFSIVGEEPQLDLYNALFHEFNGFILTKKQQTELRIFIVPPKMWTCILQHKFENQSMTPTPVLGYKSIEKLSDPSKRVVSIPSRFTPCPALIHQLRVENVLGMYFHDFAYHLWIESANPHRKAWIELAMLDDLNSSQLKQILLDRNFPVYSKLEGKYVPQESSVQFWYSLGKALYDPYPDLSPDETEKLQLELEQGLDRKILRHVLANEKIWSLKFDISLDALEEYLELLQEAISFLDAAEEQSNLSDMQAIEKKQHENVFSTLSRLKTAMDAMNLSY